MYLRSQWRASKINCSCIALPCSIANVESMPHGFIKYACACMYMNTYIMYACACMFMNTYIMKFIGYTYMHINKTMWLNAPPEPRAFYATESSVAYLAPGGLKSTPLERAGVRPTAESCRGTQRAWRRARGGLQEQP